jgi:hypothetical protein
MCTGPFLGMLLILKGLEKEFEAKELENYFIYLKTYVIINNC